MKSYRQLYQKLPRDALSILSADYSPLTLDRILAGFMCERPLTLRVNRLKTGVRAVMEAFRRENVRFERVPWYEDALVVRNRREKDLEEHVLYREGHVYLQSLSSMLPPLALRPQPGWRVLDLTAAPGGKSTQLAALMGNEGFVLANEINPIRAERLKFNIARQGASIVEVRVGDGKRLEEQWREYFDAVLLDAPCSGIGLFCLAEPRTYRGWSARRIGDLAREQKKLLEAAVRALKPGGILVYSTCTMTKEENERNIAWLLERYGGDLRLEPIPLVLPGAATVAADLGGAGEGILLVLPSELHEGFFVARLRSRPRARGD